MSQFNNATKIALNTHIDVTLGFIPLIDSAPFVIAKEKGFFEKQGIHVALSKEASWASIRDKVTFNLLQGAHMLASMPLASGFGAGSVNTKIQTSFTVSQNGNGITVSNDLYQLMSQSAIGLPDMRNGAALNAVISQLNRTNRVLKFAMVYPYSSHHYQLRDWLSRAGINPDKDVQLMVVPPTKMMDYLRAGEIDGYCVGEPWNSLAMEQGIGHMLVTGYEIWGNTPEKVLGVNQSWASENVELHCALIRALHEACEWVDDKHNIDELLEILSHPDYLSCSVEQLRYGFSAIKPSGQFDWPMEAYQTFSGDEVNRPNSNYALWLLGQMYRWQQIDISSNLIEFVNSTFNEALYCKALHRDRLVKPSPLIGSLTEFEWFEKVLQDKIRIHPEGVKSGFIGL